ncbi:MAG: [Lachnospiraceae bacterium]|nr:[FeFe] hydrogenase H-cluster maturation GTPase HydF [Lachnospiraceae bacterium]
MDLNQTTSGERIHISFFGMRNAGKSSLVNAVTGQQLSVVSDVKGTTTDPVKKAMELLPLGPVVIIDTPGLDDEGELGLLRVQKAKQILGQTDIAILVIDSTLGMSQTDTELEQEFQKRKIPYIIAWNKTDLLQTEPDSRAFASDDTHKCIFTSAFTNAGIETLKRVLADFAPKSKSQKVLVSDLVEAGDVIVLVTPIDESAPKGRLILPQQLTIRDILDAHGIVVTCQDTELTATLKRLACKPKMIITDSQVFGSVSKETPDDIPLTSFSILMARYKGDLLRLVEGASVLSKLRDGDKVLISEGCTHHRQCNDIGTVKMPGWIENFSGKKISFSFSSGGEFPEDLSPYALVVHCGGCMLNEAEMKHRTEKCNSKNVPIVNYGIAIAHMHGILKRSLTLFPDVLKLLDS